MRCRFTLTGFTVALALAGGGCAPGDPSPAAPAADAGGPSTGKEAGPPAAPLDGSSGGSPDQLAPTGQDGQSSMTNPPDAGVGADTSGPGPDLAPDPGADAAAAGPGKVLIYSRTTGFRHDSIGTAVARLSAALIQRGFVVEATEDAQVFTGAGGLQRFAGVVLLSTTGKALGDPGTQALAALEAFVQAGGALAGLHAASSTEYPPSGPLTRLLGGKFVNHPGGVRMASCHREGNHPASAALPEPFVVRDEIYVMDNLRPDNQVVLRCDAFGGSDRLPIAWFRQDAGSGRVFYTALGHADEDWQPTAAKFRDHILPGVLWSLGK